MKFCDNYDFLSNFHPSKVVDEFEIEYPTVEHAYQAAKTDNIEDKIKISKMETPGKAKRFGQKVKLVDGWEHIKDDVMFQLLLQKFQDPVLLLNLRNVVGEIVEDNDWGDTYWGVYNGRGENTLGRLLMWIRDEED